jgi:hypothetical protein
MPFRPQNSDIWQPVRNNADGQLELDTRWPPQVILNYVHAQATVKLWGTAEFCAYLRKVNGDLHAKTRGSREKAKKNIL